jgi:hypothetical protein
LFNLYPILIPPRDESFAAHNLSLLVPDVVIALVVILLPSYTSIPVSATIVTEVTAEVNTF